MKIILNVIMRIKEVKKIILNVIMSVSNIF
jgi:hypothetical protein